MEEVGLGREGTWEAGRLCPASGCCSGSCCAKRGVRSFELPWAGRVEQRGLGVTAVGGARALATGVGVRALGSFSSRQSLGSHSRFRRSLLMVRQKAHAVVGNVGTSTFGFGI